MARIILIAASAFGLEAVVRRELQGLGFGRFNTFNGRVEFEAGVEDIPRVNLWLRAADRVLLKLGEFPAADFDQLFEGAKALFWEQWIPSEAKITVAVKSVKSRLAGARANQSVVKKAVLDRLRAAGKAEIFPETGFEVVIQVSLLEDRATVMIDTTGPGLNRRGYRVETGEVPLKETLAAALVMLSFWNRDLPLIDPMCGSGTVLIEAAGIARNMAPGLRRSFASEHWPVLDPALWDKTRCAALRSALPPGGLKIFGYDCDPRRITNSKVNARRAGVDKDIVFEHRDVRDLRFDHPRGVIVTNPPYGVKLGDAADLAPVYSALNTALRDQRGWSLGVITPDKSFPRHFKRGDPQRVRKLYNGALEVNYYQYDAVRAGERAARG
jgi:putative N6-adenine-specific DNA methylase